MEGTIARCAENPTLPMFSARPSPISMRASSQIASPLKWACVARCAENPPLPMFSARPFLRTCLLYHARESTANLVVATCSHGLGFRVWQKLIFVELVLCRRWRHEHIRKQLAVVSALVGAGGNLGAVILSSMHSCQGTDWGPSDEAADSEGLIMLLSPR